MHVLQKTFCTNDLFPSPSGVTQDLTVVCKVAVFSNESDSMSAAVFYHASTNCPTKRLVALLQGKEVLMQLV